MTKSFADRLALGTAQFGLPYGINNIEGQPSIAKVAQVLDHARQAGISLLDTAAAYGDSEARLGAILPTLPDAAFQLVTKVAAGPAEDVTMRLQESLRRLQKPTLYGILFHDFAGQQQHPTAWQALQTAQATGQVKRIGVSLYHPWQVEWLLERQVSFDLVQIPFNVFDQRFSNWLPELNRRGIEVHVRSAFLQGLLLRNPATLSTFFLPLQAKLKRLHALAVGTEVPLSALLLLFAACAPGVTRAVIGVDSVANLEANVAAGQYQTAFEEVLPELRTFAEHDDTYILPYTWPPH